MNAIPPPAIPPARPSPPRSHGPRRLGSSPPLAVTSGANSTRGAEDRVSIGAGRPTPLTYGTAPDVPVPSPFEQLRTLVVRFLQEQGALAGAAEDGSAPDLSEISPGEARELLSEDGYWGVEKTSERILAFAVSAAGNDPAKLEQIKEAVEEGFRAAREAFGGTLPEISARTHDAVMEKLDQWAAEAGAG